MDVIYLLVHKAAIGLEKRWSERMAYMRMHGRNG